MIPTSDPDYLDMDKIWDPKEGPAALKRYHALAVRTARVNKKFKDKIIALTVEAKDLAIL